MVRSPCSGVCRLDAHRQVCVGCGRTAMEITEWRSLTDDEKRAVLERIKEESP